MKEWITLTEHNWTFWVAGIFALAEFLKWLFTGCEFFIDKVQKILKFFGIKIKTKRMINEERLQNVEKAIIEIKETSQKNVDMFMSHEKQVVSEFLNMKNDIITEFEQLNLKMNRNQEDSDETNCALIRAMLNSAMRYLEQNKKTNGETHISLADYETLDGLFEKYFAKGGNGAYKKAHKQFKGFIIDR